MKQDSWVPVSVIAQFGRVKNLTQDCDAIMAALKGSSVVTVDFETQMMRPKSTNDRSCIVIRDIEKDQDPAEIMALFGKHSKNVLEVQPEIGNNWFCNMKDETSARAALEHLQALRHPDGAPLGVRIRSNNYCRGTAPGFSNTRRSQTSPGQSGSPSPEYSTASHLPNGSSNGYSMPYSPEGTVMYTSDIQDSEQGKSNVGTFLYSTTTAPYEDYRYQFSGAQVSHGRGKGKGKGKDGTRRSRVEKGKGRGSRGRRDEDQMGLDDFGHSQETSGPSPPNIWSKIVLGEKPDPDQLAKYEEDMKAAGRSLPTMLSEPLVVRPSPLPLEQVSPPPPRVNSPPVKIESPPAADIHAASRVKKGEHEKHVAKTDHGGKGRSRGGKDKGNGESSRTDKGRDGKGKGGKTIKSEHAPDRQSRALVTLPAPLPPLAAKVLPATTAVSQSSRQHTTEAVSRGKDKKKMFTQSTSQSTAQSSKRMPPPQATQRQSVPQQRKESGKKQASSQKKVQTNNDWMTVRGGEIEVETIVFPEPLADTESVDDQSRTGFKALDATADTEATSVSEHDAEEDKAEDELQLYDTANKHGRKKGHKRDNNPHKKIRVPPRRQSANSDVWSNQLCRAVLGRDFVWPSKLPNFVVYGGTSLILILLLYFVIFVL
jgi:hypothetical protein